MHFDNYISIQNNYEMTIVIYIELKASNIPYNGLIFKYEVIIWIIRFSGICLLSMFLYSRANRRRKSWVALGCEIFLHVAEGENGRCHCGIAVELCDRYYAMYSPFGCSISIFFGQTIEIIFFLSTLILSGFLFRHIAHLLPFTRKEKRNKNDNRFFVNDLILLVHIHELCFLFNQRY